MSYCKDPSYCYRAGLPVDALTAERDAAYVRAQSAEARAERLEEALTRIAEWAAAYPLNVFPEPDLVKARALLEAGGMTLDGLSASAMRHCLDGAGRIARAALEPAGD